MIRAIKFLLGVQLTANIIICRTFIVYYRFAFGIIMMVNGLIVLSLE